VRANSVIDLTVVYQLTTSKEPLEAIRKINDELTIAGQVTPEQLQQVAQEGFKSVLNLRSPDEEGFLSNEQQG